MLLSSIERAIARKRAAISQLQGDLDEVRSDATLEGRATFANLSFYQQYLGRELNGLQALREVYRDGAAR
jgi:hypothetical protein